MNRYRLLFLLALVALGHLPTNSFAQSGRQTLLFNDAWRFHKGDVPDGQNAGKNDSGWRNVDLPHDWSIEGPFDQQWASATGYLPGGIGWYNKTFTLAPAMRSKKVFIYFDGVYKNSEVWINGHHLGKRPNGFIPFQYEITQHLNKTGINTVAVKADHTQFADARWYTGSGIYRNVYLVATEPLHIDLWGVQFSTPGVSAAEASARVRVTLFNQQPAKQLAVVKVRLLNASGQQVATTQQQLSIAKDQKSTAELRFNVAKPALWSDETPVLYKLETTVLQNGKPVDVQTEDVGFRWFRFDNNKGFFLNGKATKLKGVCIHDDAGALGVAVPQEVWERRLKLLKDGGCNSIRMSHNPHADYLYSLMDKMGFLVMDEAFDEWEAGKNKWIKGWNVGQPGNDGYHSDFKEWANRDVADMVLRNYNRPSIIMWSIGNEVDYPNDPYTHEVLNTGRNPQIYGKGYVAGKPPASRLTELAKQLVAAVKQHDTTRPVTAALAGVVMSNEVGFPEVLDIVGYNYQEFRYPEDHAKYPARVIYGSENGMAYNAWTPVSENEYISAQYLWTGIDYLGEARSWPSRSNQAGLIDLAGFPKPEYYYRQSLWSAKPMIYVGTSPVRMGNRRAQPRSWNYNNGDSVRVTCYTNCTEAELFVNGSSLGKKKLSDGTDKVLSWNIVYTLGEVVVKGYTNGSIASTDTIKTSGPAFGLKAVADVNSFKKQGKKLSHITVSVVDQQGVPVSNAEHEITVNINGAAKLIGLESGSSNSIEDYKANKRKAVNGKLLAYVQAGKIAGKATISVTAAGLQPATIVLD